MVVSILYGGRLDVEQDGAVLPTSLLYRIRDRTLLNNLTSPADLHAPPADRLPPAAESRVILARRSLPAASERTLYPTAPSHLSMHFP